MAVKVSERNIKVGEEVTLIDSSGGARGAHGDRAIVLDTLDGSDGLILEVKLLTGMYAGQVIRRYERRWRLSQLEWDK